MYLGGILFGVVVGFLFISDYSHCIKFNTLSDFVDFLSAIAKRIQHAINQYNKPLPSIYD